MRKKRSLLAVISALFGARNQASTNTPVGYEFKNEADSEKATLFLYGYVGDAWEGVTAKQVATDVKAANGKPLEVRINSFGGSVFEGAAIYNTLAQYSGDVDYYIDGAALSIAGVIAMAGKKGKVHMAENAWLMVHKPITSAWWENADGLRKQADLLDRLQESTLLPAFRNKTGKSDEELNKLVNTETWLTAKQALDLGFIDDIVAPIEVDNSADMAAMEFMNAPAEFLVKFGAVKPTKPTTPVNQDPAEPTPPAVPESNPAPTQEPENKTTTPDPSVPPVAEPSAAETERARVDGIMDLCTSHNLPIASAQKWIRNNTTLQQARDFAFELAAARDEATTINSQIPGGGGGGKNPLIADAERRAAAAVR